MPAITLNHSIISIVSLLYLFSFRHSVPPAPSEKTLDYQMPVWSNNKSLIQKLIPFPSFPLGQIQLQINICWIRPIPLKNNNLFNLFITQEAPIVSLVLYFKRPPFKVQYICQYLQNEGTHLQYLACQIHLCFIFPSCNQILLLNILLYLTSFQSLFFAVLTYISYAFQKLYQFRYRWIYTYQFNNAKSYHNK